MTDTPQSPQKLNATLAHGFAWTAGAKWATQLITWGSVLLAARILTPSDFGLVDMAAFFVGLTNIVAEFGLGAAVLQIRNLDRHVLAQLHTFSVMLGVAAFSCSFLAAPYVAAFFHNDKLLLLVIVTSLSFLITGFQMVPLGLLQKALDYRRLSLTEAAMACTQALVLMIGVLTGVGYWALVMAGGLLSGKAVSALLVNIWHPVGFGWPRWRQIVEPARLGWHLTVSRVGWAAYAQADSIVVGKVLGAGSLGTYRIATDLASAPSEKLGMLIMRVTGPFFASVQSDTATVRRYFILFSESLALSVFPMMFGIAAISQEPDSGRVGQSLEWCRHGVALAVPLCGIPNAQHVNGTGTHLLAPHPIHDVDLVAFRSRDGAHLHDRFPLGNWSGRGFVAAPFPRDHRHSRLLAPPAHPALRYRVRESAGACRHQLHHHGDGRAADSSLAAARTERLSASGNPDPGGSHFVHVYFMVAISPDGTAVSAVPISTPHRAECSRAEEFGQ